jgi:hypothetical protein
VTDASFNEFQLICRRALADFGPMLRQRVLRLFHDSLSRSACWGWTASWTTGMRMRRRTSRIGAPALVQAGRLNVG